MNGLVAWMVRNLDIEDVRTLMDHGADAGIPGLIYYKEIEVMYNLFTQDVWDAVNDYRDVTGMSIGDFMNQTFESPCYNHDEFITGLVWFASEYYASVALSIMERMAA